MAGEVTQDWVARVADEVVGEAARRGSGGVITCASGISPSGPVHLGNLREIMVPHLVYDEIARRGVPARHILSWDDYDRLRKVPAGVPESFAEHIGRPLSAIPDPCGDHANWAEHYREPFRASLTELGVDTAEISQTEMYTAGRYHEQIVTAMRQRDQISAVLARYRTKRTAEDADDDPVADGAYYPFRPYCPACGRDTTTVTSFDDDTTEISYICAYDTAHGPTPIAEVAGKLVWKVDWPMRWAYENVTFEAGGVDHSTPGSSFTVGAQLVREIFAAEPPHYLPYSFVGTSGSAKMSGSTGGAPTPGDALRIFEVPVLRWLYTRRRPNQAITLAFDQEVSRTYDEWDGLTRRVLAGQATPVDAIIHTRATTVAHATLPRTPRPLPFRTLASIADVTAGDGQQLRRILRDLTPDDPISELSQTQPRLDRARAWVAEYIEPQDRTQPAPNPTPPC